MHVSTMDAVATSLVLLHALVLLIVVHPVLHLQPFIIFSGASHTTHSFL